MLSLSALCYVYFKTLWVDRYIHSSSLQEISIINFHRAICFHGLLNLLILSKIATTALFYILGNITVVKHFCLKYRKCHCSTDLESKVHGIGSWGLDSHLIFRTCLIWIDWSPREGTAPAGREVPAAQDAGPSATCQAALAELSTWPEFLGIRKSGDSVES